MPKKKKTDLDYISAPFNPLTYILKIIILLPEYSDLNVWIRP